MASKDLVCPFCKHILALHSLRFDSQLNLICSFCPKVVFPASEGAAYELRQLFPVEPYSTGWKKEPLPIKVVEVGCA